MKYTSPFMHTRQVCRAIACGTVELLSETSRSRPSSGTRRTILESGHFDSAHLHRQNTPSASTQSRARILPVLSIFNRHGTPRTRLLRRKPPRPCSHRQPQLPSETSQRPGSRFEGVPPTRNDAVLVQSALRNYPSAWGDRMQASSATVSTVSLAKEKPDVPY